MNHGLRLAGIPAKDYDQYRYQVIFGGYKWDPQVGDDNTVSRHVLLIAPDTAEQLARWAEQLARETDGLERAFSRAPHLAKALRLPPKLRRHLPKLQGYDPDRHVRLMRFDFHPTAGGWAVSEVNSDVPGGLAEASVLPAIAAPFFPGHGPGPDLGALLADALTKKAGPGGSVGLVHATSYADDRQVMQFLGDRLKTCGHRPVYLAPDHIRWQGGRAYSILEGHEGQLSALMRFFPLEWLTRLPRACHWPGYFDCQTPCCNHPAAIFAQSKRLPLAWDGPGLPLPGWKALLPPTVDPRKAAPGMVLKPALGRVGEGIGIGEAVPPKELKAIRRSALLHPHGWVAQERFDSQPLAGQDGQPYHLCLGVFTVDGRCAGYYGRLSRYPRIDARAQDIPILVREE